MYGKKEVNAYLYMNSTVDEEVEESLQKMMTH
jgi:hypothetical protein